MGDEYADYLNRMVCSQCVCVCVCCLLSMVCAKTLRRINGHSSPSHIAAHAGRINNNNNNSSSSTTTTTIVKKTTVAPVVVIATAAASSSNGNSGKYHKRNARLQQYRQNLGDEYAV